MPPKKAVTPEQRQAQARFVEQMQTLIPSAQQRTIFQRAATQQGHYVVNAGPGSGKTTTAIKASTYFRGTSLYLAFNRKIRDETVVKLRALRSRMTASTLHSFGFSCLHAFTRGKTQVDEQKYERLATTFLREQWASFLSTLPDSEALPPERMPSKVEAREWSLTLLHYVQVTLATPDEASLLALIEQFDLTEITPRAAVWPFVCRMVPFLLEEGKQYFLKTGVVSFDDMLSYPCLLPDVPVRTYDHIILDEAQDASRAALGLVQRACHASTQVFAIGDEKQSIYAFAGADIDSISHIVTAFHAEVLPLRICYRCGTAILALANALGGQIIPAPNAHSGTVQVISSAAYLALLQPNDVVISRTTAPLIADCLKVLQTGRRAMVLGRDLGRSIAALVSRLEELRVGRGTPALKSDLSNLLEVLEQYSTIQCDLLTERYERPQRERAISELLDRVETVKAFFLAYHERCLNPRLITPYDPTCAFDRTAHDFKQSV